MQNITQTLTIQVGDPSTINTLADTGISTPFIIAIAIAIISIALLGWLFIRRRTKLTSSFRGLTVLAIIGLASASLGLSLHLGQPVLAEPSLSLGTTDSNLTITIPKGGGTDSATTTITSSTVNPDGYTLKASLAKTEPGIDIELKGGAVATPTALNPSTSPLTLKTTTSATAPGTSDSTPITLSFTVDSSVKPGKKTLQLTYQATDNTPTGPTTPTTMQSMTSAYCNSMAIYDGTNPEAMLTLSDPRGDGANYHVAKLADNHCWMLDNLRLGSTSSTLTLTPSDTDITSNFTLPQLYAGSDSSHQSSDTPEAFGPVPGDTGTADTNYGYLYNFPAATAGETTTSLPGDGTNGDNAPYSICPKNWRLPIIAYDSDNSTFSGDYPSLDIAFGGTGQYAGSGETNIAKWQYTGPFRGTFAGYWGDGFDGQGGGGVLWSASAGPGVPGYALHAYFYSDEVYPGNGYVRGLGLSIRCLLQ